MAQPFDRLVIFGDSLSDTGNIHMVTGGLIPQSPPYFNGRFSNGPIWVEYLANTLNIPAENITNNALGGATTQVVAQLVDAHLTSNTITPNTLYIVWGGANDLLDILDNNPNIDPNENFLADALTDLAVAGAEHILVPNVPNLGQTPRMLETNDPTQIADATANTIAFNDRLQTTIETVNQSFSLDILTLDTFTAIEQIVADPTAFDFTNVTTPALLPDDTTVPNPNDHLFWDDIHPTTAAHALLADLAAQTIPEPASLALLSTLVATLTFRREPRTR